MTLLVWVGVVLFGGVGAVLRFLLDRSISGRLGRLFPYGTLVVNVSGAAALGMISGLALGDTEALLAGTATIGAYTTFSTWMFETQRLAEDRQVLALGGNIVVSLVRRRGRGGGRALARGIAVNDDCLKLTAYFGERGRAEGRFLADVMLDLFGDREIATSVLMRGIEGFGFKHHLRTDRLLTLSEDLPLVAVAVDERHRVESLLADLMTVDHHALLTLERARMLRGEIGPVTLPQELHEATKLTVYVGRQERVYRAPAFAAVCDLLHRRGIAGATVLLGVDGTAHGVRERARFIGRNADVPMMIIAVGDGERIGRVLPELGGLLRRPLVTLERVRVCKRNGELVAPPQQLPGTDERAGRCGRS